MVAGHEYGMKQIPSDDWWDFQIEDMATGERVDTPMNSK
ncbi:hypothetical protein BN844_1170 [Pseudomonas sp. SHC52]|nr:hypothetical protein BN844_1170 [Pseudomonas sp. SHC52]